MVEWKCRRGANAGAGVGISSMLVFLPGEPYHPAHEEMAVKEPCMNLLDTKAALAGVRAFNLIYDAWGLSKIFVAKGALVRIEIRLFFPRALSPAF
jgi:hypothetical protein